MKNYLKSGLLEVSQLQEILQNNKGVKNLRILDCTLPFSKGFSLFKKQRIPNALFLDLYSLRDSEDRNISRHAIMLTRRLKFYQI